MSEAASARLAPNDAGAGGGRSAKPRASGQRLFWAYALHGLGALIGVIAVGLTLWLAPMYYGIYAQLIDAGDSYGAGVTRAWNTAFLDAIAVFAALGVLIAVAGLPVLRGRYRSPIAWILVGVAVVGLVAAIVGVVVIQNQGTQS
ncbi:hypothetical protein [Leifsonia sp. Leaf264]|uniref:hypothetical protein n=1 Tax=Leifsonia sp. Leaf264 TaxID=1736314 RepID=UPI0006FB1FAB|nr:hypothetical protein [Leifsonia sp. Leaf264]KQO97684.1 hypothetical protein ASF30_14855 [Leifsonia sp. Leaf264]